MRFWKLRVLGGAWLALAIASGAPAADPGADQAGVAVVDPAPSELGAGADPAPGTEASAAPEADPGEPLAAPAAQAETAPAPEAPQADAPAPAEPVLGPIGHDSQGRPGRIHFVVAGDTLWDISAAYLGSAWVWPSVWRENRSIENPHRIYPGDRIWITDGEMRRVSAEEAEAMLARAPTASEPSEPPAAPAPEPEPPAVAVPETRTRLRVSDLESAGLIPAERMSSAISIVDAVPQQVLLSQGDRVYLGLGEGEVSVGDQFTAFRNEEKVYDPESGRLLGYHVDLLGWVEVEEVHEETAVARIRVSNSEIERGDRVVPREPVHVDVEVRPPPEGLQGQISFFAKSRTITHQVDYVYLNRGAAEGLEVGSPLEVYRPAYRARERARGASVKVPDLYVASLLVVRVQPETAVAFVVHSERDLVVGDHVRGATTQAASRR